jgi:DNA-binding transcriptional LysR family regulator
LVGAGFGVSLVPKSARADEAGVVALPVRTPRCYRTFGLSWARGRYLPQRTLAFREFLVDALQRREQRNGRVRTA